MAHHNTGPDSLSENIEMYVLRVALLQQDDQPAIQPLTMVRSEQVVRLVSIQASRTLSRRLAELGLTPGIEMAVVRDNGGPILLGIRHSRLALGRSLAQKIMVQPFKEV